MKLAQPEFQQKKLQKNQLYPDCWPETEYGSVICGCPKQGKDLLIIATITYSTLGLCRCYRTILGLYSDTHYWGHLARIEPGTITLTPIWVGDSEVLQAITLVLWNYLLFLGYIYYTRGGYILFCLKASIRKVLALSPLRWQPASSAGRGMTTLDTCHLPPDYSLQQFPTIDEGGFLGWKLCGRLCVYAVAVYPDFLNASEGPLVL